VRVAVYTIALNEESFVEPWATSAADADVRIIADTGSTDGTVDAARAAGVDVHGVSVYPWRFDDARNASLALVPADIDYCIALDMDEVLLPGWREQLERAHENGWTRPRYRYVWSWRADGRPDLVYGGDKIHTRRGYRWKHPVHETLRPAGHESSGWIDLEIHHHPDLTKSRGQYLPMLEQAVCEDPTDDRNTHYLAREFYFAGRHDEAVAEFKRHLELPKALWEPERAASMRYLAKMLPNEAERWLLRACAEAPGHREPWLDLARLYVLNGMEDEARGVARRALRYITERQLDYLTESDAWSGELERIAAL
jgi:glycosyltransferase involved in cell wall biosynthesis